MTEQTYPADLDEQVQRANDRLIETAGQIASHLTAITKIAERLVQSLATMPDPHDSRWWEWEQQMAGLKAAQQRHQQAWDELCQLGALRNRRDGLI